MQDAVAAKRRAHSAPTSWDRSAPPAPTVYEAFEQLREKAEAQVETHEGDRRPSWAPPLIFGDELAGVCRALEYLTPDDKPIGRLWATFATPKRSGRYVREHVSSLPLHGLSCRGFQLFAGDERGSTSEILFEAQRDKDGSWSFGPSFCHHSYYSPRAREWERLVREREQWTDSVRAHPDDASFSQRLAKVTSEIAAIDEQDAAAAERHHERERLRQRAYELAQARMLDFVGAPDAQMQAAGRLWGHCCRCGKALTDPLSLERGIGPDCYQGILLAVRAMAAEGYAAERISYLIGMSVEFCTTVLSEPASKPRRHPRQTPDLFNSATSEVGADDEWMLPGE